MDVKEIATKVVEGGDEVELTKDLDDVAKSSFYKELAVQRKAVADRELTVIEARRKEAERLKGNTDEVTNNAINAVRTEMRGNQVREARGKFMADMALTEDQMKTYDEDFKSRDSGKLDTDPYVVFKGIYAEKNADTLISAQRTIQENERNAANFNANGAGGGNPGGGSGDTEKKYSTEIIAMVREAQKQGFSLTPEEAERGMKGGKRVF